MDRPSHELRKERYECGEADEAGFRLDTLAVAVDGVAHRLECVERDASRQLPAGHSHLVGDAHVGQRPVEVGDDETGVLERGQQQDVIADRQRQPQAAAAALAHPQDGKVIDDGGVGDKQQEERAPPPVEDVGRSQQPRVAQPGPLGQQVDRVEDQEEDGEYPGVEEHFPLSAWPLRAQRVTAGLPGSACGFRGRSRPFAARPPPPATPSGEAP